MKQNIVWFIFGVLAALVAMQLGACAAARPPAPEYREPMPYVVETIIATRAENFGICEPTRMEVINPTSQFLKIRIECGLSYLSYMDFEEHERAQDFCVPAGGTVRGVNCMESLADRGECFVARAEPSDPERCRKK